jgi:hypothetical protein
MSEGVHFKLPCAHEADAPPYYAATVRALCAMLLIQQPPKVDMSVLELATKCKKLGKDVLKNLTVEQQIEFDEYMHNKGELHGNTG